MLVLLPGNDGGLPGLLVSGGQLGMVKGRSVVESETSASNLLGGLEPGPLHLRTLELVYRECAPWCLVATGAGGPRTQGAWSGTDTG